MLWNPVSEDIITLSIARARVEYEKGVKREIEKRKEVHDGMLGEHVKARIKLMFSIVDESDELTRLISKSVNVLRYALNQIATLYQYGVSRKWQVKTPEVDEKGKKKLYDVEASDTYANILEQCDADETMKLVHRMMLLCHDVILRYQWTERGHALIPLTRDQCDVIQDEKDPRVAQALIWCTSRRQTPAFDGKESPDLVWHFMDAMVHKLYDAGGKLLWTKPNDYAALNMRVNTFSGSGVFAPFIDFHDEVRWDTFWRENLDEVLFDAAIETCVWLTYLNGQLKYCTFKQGWKATTTTGTATNVIQQGKAVEGGFTRMLNLGAGGQAGLLDYTADIMATMSALKEKLRLFGQCIGLGDNAFEIVASPQSGVAIRLRNEGLNERQSREAMMFSRKERSLAAIIQFASNPSPVGAGFINYPKDQRVNPELDPRKMRVDFSDVARQGLDPEQRAFWQWKLERGLATHSQFLMAENTDLDEAEAEQMAQKAYDEHLRRLAEAAKAQTYGTIPQREGVEEGDEEIGGQE